MGFTVFGALLVFTLQVTQSKLSLFGGGGGGGGGKLCAKHANVFFHKKATVHCFLPWPTCQVNDIYSRSSFHVQGACRL